MGDLLAAAPWVFARGNHELCSRAGPGWFYFLDAGSNLAESVDKQLSCPTPDPSKNPIENVVLVEPYSVNLNSLNVIVLDSANACDGFAPPQAQDFLDQYSNQFATVEGLAAASPDMGSPNLRAGSEYGLHSGKPVLLRQSNAAIRHHP